MMKSDIRQQARIRLDRRLSVILKTADQFHPPPKGWMRAIRDALGMSAAQLARRLGIRRQSVEDLEKSEVNGTIELRNLRRVAEALECRLVYALVPQTSLEDVVKKRARKLATRDLQRIAHTMKLEDQETGNADFEARIEAYIRDKIKDRDLWSDQ